MPYDPSNGVRLDELIYLVRVRLGDHVQEGYDTAEGDGTTDRFALTHVNLLEDSLSVYVDSVYDATATVDERSGWVSFSSIPADGAVIAFSYQYSVWSDERITEAVNQGIDELVGKFYVRGRNDAIYTDGTAEVEVVTSDDESLADDDRITRVEAWNEERWVRLDRWHVDTNEGKFIVFENTPIEDLQLRVSYVKKPGYLSATSDTLETTSGFGDLAVRVKEPIVLYACAALIVDRIHHRIREDRGHNTQNENPVKSYEIQNDASYLRSLADVIASRVRMDPLFARVRF